jgi:hypothetical protein
MTYGTVYPFSCRPDAEIYAANIILCRVINDAKLMFFSNNIKVLISANVLKPEFFLQSKERKLIHKRSFFL